MSSTADSSLDRQQQRNHNLIAQSHYMRREVASRVLPLQFDIAAKPTLEAEDAAALQAIEIKSARIAIKSLASLAKIGELDHLGGALDLIPALTLTLAVTDYDKTAYTIENAHTSIGYYAALAAYGFLDPDVVIDEFRRGLDIAGHVSWIPGGTQLNGGRLGVMVPVAVGQALGKKALLGAGAWVITHCGDAGWISGQALNGFNAADLHAAPITFVMHRNGIQLSGPTRKMMDKDPRPIVESLGVQIIEIESLHDTASLYAAYRQGFELAQQGRPSLVYPTGSKSTAEQTVDLRSFGESHGILAQVEAMAAANQVSLDTPIWVPGALMSYRDVEPMLECIFLVNDLPGGAGHHDGHMKGRDVDAVLANPMLALNADQQAALDRLGQQPRRGVVSTARPAPGSRNLVLPTAALEEAELPAPGKPVSARGGSQAAYELVAKHFPKQVFVVSCDLDPSTKLDKAKAQLDADHCFEMSIQEQASAMLANGLAMSSNQPQLNVFSTFSAFFEGIAREGLEMWRYQRNLNGANEGLNVAFHLSHVGANTGRDHFSGWSLDWVTLALGYLPYLHRFYAPADARAAFVAAIDLAAHYGAHIIAIPRDNLPILEKQDGSGPLWEASSAWEPITPLRQHDGARRAILALGAAAYLAADAAAALLDQGTPTDAYVVNGFPLEDGQLEALFERYPDGIATIEDGIIGTRQSGLRGLAGVAAGTANGVPTAHLGIVDPRVAPSEGFPEVWEHFGLTAEALADAVAAL